MKLDLTMTFHLNELEQNIQKNACKNGQQYILVPAPKGVVTKFPLLFPGIKEEYKCDV